MDLQLPTLYFFFYHDAFVECLQDLHCDVTPYTLDSFQKEMEHFGPLEASHILIMYKAVFGDKALNNPQLPDCFFLFPLNRDKHKNVGRA
ncbi:hypothetical protein CBL_01462 [Carabus blaptoides fortunei]